MIVGQRARDAGPSGYIHGSIRQRELGSIGKIEEFGPKLQRVVFRNMELFQNGKIEVALIGPTQCASSTIPKNVSKCLTRSQGRKNKRCLIVKTVESLVPRRTTTQRSLRGYIKREVS